MVLTIDKIKADIKEKGFDISNSDISTVFLYKLTANKTTSYALGQARDKWNVQSSCSAATSYFKNPKITLLLNYLEPVFVDYARAYLSENLGHFLDIIDTRRNYSPEKLPENVLEYVNENPEKRSREDLEILLNRALDKLDPSNQAHAKTIADISIQLAKNFQPETIEYNQVIVEEKYNSICPYCNHEISVKPQTKN